MIAIPIDETSGEIRSSKLFGNAPMFALYDPANKTFGYKENTGFGDGIKTAQTLIGWGVKETVYTYLGDGPFNAMTQNGIKVFYIGKEPLELSLIVHKMDHKEFIEVNYTNTTDYLDPGTTVGSCECGCNHE